jgi:uncharacterized membrane protein YoaK (UPF0700 family)
MRLPPVLGTHAITAVCGLLDAATFLKLGNVFSTVMTGNVLLLAFAVGTRGITALRPVLSGTVPPYIVALLSFAVGAVLGGRLVHLGEPGRRIGLLLDALMIGGAALAAWRLHPTPVDAARYVVFGILAAAMGIQNALLRKWSTQDTATNLFTLNITGLLADGRNQRALRRGMSLAIFTASAVAGAVLCRYGVVWPIVASFIVVSVALPVLFRAAERPVTLAASSARSASRWLSPGRRCC